MAVYKRQDGIYRAQNHTVQTKDPFSGSKKIGGKAKSHGQNDGHPQLSAVAGVQKQYAKGGYRYKKQDVLQKHKTKMQDTHQPFLYGKKDRYRVAQYTKALVKQSCTKAEGKGVQYHRPIGIRSVDIRKQALVLSSEEAALFGHTVHVVQSAKASHDRQLSRFHTQRDNADLRAVHGERSLCGGKRVFLLAKMPEKKILDEDFDPYICFTNTHDGSGSIKAIMTPVRVVCQNTLSLALQGATRSWSTRHLGDMGSKLAEAKYTLKMANDYMDKFAVAADQLANTTITEDQAMKVVDELFPITTEMSDRQARNMVDKKENFMVCMFAPDILKYKGTAYQMVQAASDFATHTAPKRKTSTYQERNFASVLDGNVVIDTTFLKMMELVKNRT